MGDMNPTRRLLFWLWTPYVSDVVMVAIGVGMLVAGDSAGWLAIVFAAVRALLGTVALLLAYRMIARRP
jgi:hypothetical protein